MNLALVVDVSNFKLALLFSGLSVRNICRATIRGADSVNKQGLSSRRVYEALNY